MVRLFFSVVSTTEDDDRVPSIGFEGSRHVPSRLDPRDRRLDFFRPDFAGEELPVTSPWLKSKSCKVSGVSVEG
jgi:hypothetical protein